MEKDIFVRSEKINLIVEDHPEMSLAFIKRIPEILEDPVMILKSRNVKRGNSANTRMILYGGIRSSNGLPVLVVLDLRPVENGIVVEDMQKVSSAWNT